MTTDARELRVQTANALIAVIASVGRRFLRHGDRIGYFYLAKGRPWYVDAYRGKPIYVLYRGRWRYFTEGGTLKELVQHLTDYIMRGKQVHGGVLGPWPDWICGGDLWGYGDDMEHVRLVAALLGITKEKADDKPTRNRRATDQTTGRTGE